ncbi:MAG: lipopolysaccharide biosynthesis protein, partial [Thermodesulfobacteriota bacterium]
MSISFSKSFRKTADGAVWGFLAEALMLPTGLITTGYLTRNLGPEGYGIFTLAATLVGWVTFSTTSLFSRTTIKFVSEANDWRPVGTTVLRLNLACGVGAMLLLWFAAEPISMLLHEPKLKIYLQIFSLEPLFFILARAHRFILIGTGNFRKQSIPSAVRWLARSVLIIFLVESGLSISGAILGSVAAAILELAIYRFYV